MEKQRQMNVFFYFRSSNMAAMTSFAHQEFTVVVMLLSVSSYLLQFVFVASACLFLLVLIL